MERVLSVVDTLVFVGMLQAVEGMQHCWQDRAVVPQLGHLQGEATESFHKCQLKVSKKSRSTFKSSVSVFNCHT